MVDVHNFSYQGHTSGLFGFEQQLQTILPQSLEGIGGGAGFEGATPQQGSAGSFYRFGDLDDLFFGLHRTGTGDHLEILSAEFAPSYIHNGIVGVKFAIGAFVGLLDAFDIFHMTVGLNPIDIDGRGIPHQSQNGGLGTIDGIDFHIAQFLDPADDLLGFLTSGVVF